MSYPVPLQPLQKPSSARDLEAGFLEQILIPEIQISGASAIDNG